MMKDSFNKAYNLIMQQNNIIDTLKNIKRNASHILFTSSLNDEISNQIKQSEVMLNKFDSLLSKIKNELDNNLSVDDSKKPILNLYNYIMGNDYVEDLNTHKISELNKFGLRQKLNYIIRDDNEQIKWLYDILRTPHKLNFNNSEVLIRAKKDPHSKLLKEIFEFKPKQGMGKGEVLLAFYFPMSFENTEGCDLISKGGKYFEVKSAAGCINTDFEGHIKSGKTELYYIYVTETRTGLYYSIKDRRQIQTFITQVLDAANYIVYNNADPEKKETCLKDNPDLKEWPDNWRVKESPDPGSGNYILVAPRSGGGIKIPWKRFKDIK